MKYLMIFCMLLFMLPASFAEVPPEPDEAQLLVSFSQTGDNIATGGMFTAPFERDRLNGYFVLTGSHLHDDGATEETQRLGYIEAGIAGRFVELNGFLKAQRNSVRDLERQWDGGYFIQLPKLERRNLVLSAGIGNFARSEITEIDAEAGTTFHWRTFIQATHTSGIGLKFETNHGIDITSDLELYLIPSLSVEIGDKFNLDILLTLVSADGDTHVDTSIGLKRSF